MSIDKCKNKQFLDPNHCDGSQRSSDLMQSTSRETEELSEQDSSGFGNGKMKPVKCKNGHFYDANIFEFCPHCGTRDFLTSEETQESEFYKEDNFDSEGVTIILDSV